ncbi:MAG TPA: hypothetical protein VFS42_01855 [Burkholderiaceae bacterium]|nr:hypothetical protein [Burkholderiaceae bacterium]
MSEISANNNRALTHGRMHQCASVLAELVQAAKTIAPRAHLAFELAGIPPFNDMAMTDVFLEERRVASTGFVTSSFNPALNVPYEYVLLSFSYGGPHVHTVVRESPAEVERLESLLHERRIRFTVNVVRNARAQLERATFSIESVIAAGVKVLPDYDTGLIRFVLRNIGRLADTEARFRARDLTPLAFEELSRCIVGLPNEFLRAASQSTSGDAKPVLIHPDRASPKN